jgi:hypothetical protein
MLAGPSQLSSFFLCGDGDCDEESSCLSRSKSSAHVAWNNERKAKSDAGDATEISSDRVETSGGSSSLKLPFQKCHASS